MSDRAPALSHLIERLALPTKSARKVSFSADETARAALAAELGLQAVDRLEVTAQIRPIGDAVWAIDGAIDARVTQACVVTLAPVKARVAEPFSRIVSAAATTDFGLEIDIDVEAEDPAEPLGDGVDLGEMATEALALGLDPYPRAKGAAFAPVSAIPPGAEPITAEETKPFAGLASLKKAMEGDG